MSRGALRHAQCGRRAAVSRIAVPSSRENPQSDWMVRTRVRRARCVDLCQQRAKKATRATTGARHDIDMEEKAAMLAPLCGRQRLLGSRSPVMGSGGRQQRRKSLVLAMACALVISTVVRGQALDKPRMFDDYVLKSWSSQDGLFGGWIVGIAQDQDGYLWLATVSGLVRFDGFSFEPFSSSDGTRLPQRSLASIHAARDGSIWVGFSGSGGVSRIHGGRVTVYGRSDGLGAGRVTAIVEATDNRILAVTAEGLYRFINDRWTRLGEEHGLPNGQVHDVYQNRAGVLWVSSSAGVFCRKPGEEKFETIDELVQFGLSFSESTNGAMWITEPSVGFKRLELGAQRRPPTHRLTGEGYKILADRFGNLWVATLDKGLWFVPDSESINPTPQLIGTHDGLSNDSVRSLFEDRDGTVWVGTTDGLHRFARRRVTAITDLGVVRAVEVDHNGDAWIGTASGLVRLSSTGDRRQYGVEDGLPSLDTFALHVDRSRKLLIGTAAGVAVLSEGQFSSLPLDGRDWPTGAYALTSDSSGTVWIASRNQGLFRWRDGQLAPVQPSQEISNTGVDSLARDSHGRLWLILNRGGLGLFDDLGRFRLIRQGDDFHRSDLGAYDDGRGAVWFGGGTRLARIKEGRLEAIDGLSTLPAEAIRAIVGDDEGYLWIGTSGGIVRLASTEFDAALVDPSWHVDFRYYDSEDGLAGTPVRSGYPNVARGRDGRLWFVTSQGLTVVEPWRLSASRPAPPARIERIVADGRWLDPSGTFTLPPRTANIEIEYTAPAFFSPRQVRFRHRLEGLEDSWIDAGTRRQVSYANLRPGNYRFRVATRSSEGIWNEQGDSVQFSVQPTIYQTNLFLVLVSMCIGTFLLMGWRFRMHRFRRQFRLILGERARLAREIHDTLLQSLAGLELQVDAMAVQLDLSAMPVKRQLDRMRRQIQRDISEARQSIWNLRSSTREDRYLPSALRELGESLLASRGVRFECKVSGRPSRCNPKVEEHLLRIGREAISNAARHAQPNSVRVDLRYKRDSIVMRVLDDGRGFDTKELKVSDMSHWGLTTMRERAQSIGAQLKLTSTQSAGTKLVVRAPLFQLPVSNP